MSSVETTVKSTDATKFGTRTLRITGCANFKLT